MKYNMKLLLVCVTEGKFPQMESVWHDLFNKICGDSSELVIRDTTPGLTRVQDLVYSWGRMQNSRSFCERAIEAQREGFDAVTTTCTGDVGVREAREVVDIPVIAPGQSTLHYACLLGDKFGIIGPNERGGALGWGQVVSSYGLQSKAIVNPVRRSRVPLVDAATKGFDNPSMIINDVEEVAKELVNDGAEVVIIGCGVSAPICTINGFVKLDEDVPLLDPISMAFKTAQQVVELKNSLGLPALSRAGMYPRIPDKHLQRIREHVGLARQ